MFGHFTTLCMKGLSRWVFSQKKYVSVLIHLCCLQYYLTFNDRINKRVLNLSLYSTWYFHLFHQGHISAKFVTYQLSSDKLEGILPRIYSRRITDAFGSFPILIATNLVLGGISGPCFWVRGKIPPYLNFWLRKARLTKLC